MFHKAILNVQPLGFFWPVRDPFLFCVHHQDAYPAGNQEQGPAASLNGRSLGQDFTLRDGWRMYHGVRVPGFPAHPHRGFETVTVVLEGFVDHSDSHGAAGRYGTGDVQWMTAGAGLQHSEMFPLREQDRDNPVELFQIWLNLPASKKLCAPHFRMLWAATIPVVRQIDAQGRATEIMVYAGRFLGTKAPDPAPDSWAADPENGVGVWTIHVPPGGAWSLPAARSELRRTLYYYAGSGARIAGVDLATYSAVDLAPEQEVPVEAGAAGAPNKTWSPGLSFACSQYIQYSIFFTIFIR